MTTKEEQLRKGREQERQALQEKIDKVVDNLNLDAVEYDIEKFKQKLKEAIK